MRFAGSQGLTHDRPRRADLAAWAAGIVGGLVTLGPGLRPGPILGLDSVLVERVPVPSAVWGLGPQLSQRLPIGLLVAWAAPVGGSALVARILLVAAIATAVAGVARLVSTAPLVVRLGTGLLYGIGPFALTRAGVGHLHVLVTMAALPWALPWLLRPAADLRRTFVWSCALCAGGSTGGVIALILVGVGALADRRRVFTCLAVTILGQAAWLGPAIATVSTQPSLGGSANFPTAVGSPAGLLRLAVGGGFWRPENQVGGGASQALLGAVVLGMAIVGHTSLPAVWRTRALVTAGLGALAAAASGLPVLRSAWDVLSSTAPGVALRESQRADVLVLVWVAPAAGMGAIRLARGLAATGPRVAAVALALPLSTGLLLASPGLWGVMGSLRPTSFPAGWGDAKIEIDKRPGTVLALPWHEYLTTRFTQGRRILNPLPDYLGGDVLSSYDPEQGPPHQEQADDRATGINELVLATEQGKTIAGDLAARGVRWVLLVHEVDFSGYRGLFTDPGLRLVVENTDVDLFEVLGWTGTIVTNDGGSITANQPVAPIAMLERSVSGRWYRAGSPGWMQGFRAVSRDAFGTLLLPGGSTFVWYWPAFFVVTIQVGWAVALVWNWAHRRRPV
jgi:hypothetical protein